MANSDRRRFLKDILTALAATGTVVLGSTVTAKPVDTAEPKPEQPDDIQDRAGQIADTAGATESEVALSEFVNGAFRNGGFVNGGFRNGGFANGGGGFRKGGFANGGGGGFRKGGFRNF